MSAQARRRGKGWPAWLPFYYGWVIVAVAFVTMAIGVSARTAFSLLMPPMIDEFGWDRGLAAGAFSFGFLVSAILSPFIGRIVERHGPRLVIETGVLSMAAGLFLAPMIATAWHLYVTLGVLVGGGANLMGYAGQSLYLPNWFQRRRGFAISIAFSGVGAGAILLLPWWQTIIREEAWRAACQAMGLLVLLVLGPLNLLVRNRLKDLGLLPDGEVTSVAPETSGDRLVRDPAWASIEWTLARAIRTARFWWLALAFFTALFAWYAVQVHQTAYLIEIGFSASLAALALGLVSVVAIPGQIGLGTFSDRIGREWVGPLAALAALASLSATHP